MDFFSIAQVNIISKDAVLIIFIDGNTHAITGIQEVAAFLSWYNKAYYDWRSGGD